MSDICFARVDRIGDLILTLPCEKSWRTVRPRDSIVWLVNENLKFVMEHADPAAEAIYVPATKGNLMARLKGARELSKRLRGRNFETVVAFHVPWWVAMAFWMAGIKSRIGPASQWFSWLFFNRRLRQKRSESLKHESRYNEDLTRFALNPFSGAAESLPLQLEPTRLVPRPAAVDYWKLRLKERGVESRPLVVLHPGMAGSARNWPPHYYKELAMRCLEAHRAVVVTGSDIDRGFIKSTGLLELPGVVSVVGETSGGDLLALLSLASAVVAPSTGVAHLAASLGVPLAGIYSPVRVQAPLRWSPLGPAVRVFVPPVSCPGTRACLGPRCSQYDCLEKIPVESIAAYVMDNS